MKKTVKTATVLYYIVSRLVLNTDIVKLLNIFSVLCTVFTISQHLKRVLRNVDIRLAV